MSNFSYLIFIKKYGIIKENDFFAERDIADPFLFYLTLLKKYVIIKKRTFLPAGPPIYKKPQTACNIEKIAFDIWNFWKGYTLREG